MKCKGCGKHPDEIFEYVFGAEELGITPEEYVKNEEGTYNHLAKLFWCTECYVIAGTPKGKAQP